MEIPIFDFSAFFHGGHIEKGYFYYIACDLLLAACFIRKSTKIYRNKANLRDLKAATGL